MLIKEHTLIVRDEEQKYGEDGGPEGHAVVDGHQQAGGIPGDRGSQPDISDGRGEGPIEGVHGRLNESKESKESKQLKAKGAFFFLSGRL